VLVCLAEFFVILSLLVVNKRADKHSGQLVNQSVQINLYRAVRPE